MPEPPIWDDTYDGPRWRYGLRLRPAGMASLPKGWIIKSDRPHEDYAHGTIDFTRRLRQSEVDAFELEFVSQP